MRVIVTGGAGFIGSHVADALVARGHAVAVVDDLSSGDPANVSARAAFYQGSVTDGEFLREVWNDFRPELVNHHAAQISVSRSVEDPVADAAANVLGSVRVLEASRAVGVGHVTVASTGGALYGNAPALPCDESAPVTPLSPYGVAKASVEGYLDLYRRTYALPTVALRYANVYGPRQSAHGEAGVVAIFAGKMLAGSTPTVFGTGEQRRDWIYVGDVVTANLLAMERRLTGAFNVGTGVAPSLNELVELLRSCTGYGGTIAHAPERPGEVQRIALDSSRLGRAVGWSPAVGLEEGVRRTVESLLTRP